jgi:general secretion pathway protein A
MYNAFFGLDADPFRVNPDPRFLYPAEGHREALATLTYAIRERKGFVVITGEVGTGKTTVLNALLRTLEPDVQAAYLFNTSLSLGDFFGSFFDELGLERIEPFRKGKALNRLNHHLIDRLRKGKQTLLIVDEAQNLSAALLEEIRMLSNLETPQSKLLQIFLVGQPELWKKLCKPNLRQLRQRVELFQRIRPLTSAETAEYVRERLLRAGHATGDLFSGSALRALYDCSEGIPRIVNVLCDSALITGFASETTQISARMVREAGRDLGLTGGESEPESEERAEVGRVGWLRRLIGRHRSNGSAHL